MPRALRADFEGHPLPCPFLSAETPEVQGTNTATLECTPWGRSQHGASHSWAPSDARGKGTTATGTGEQLPGWKENAWHSSSGKRRLSRSQAGTAAPACQRWALRSGTLAEPRGSCGQSGQSFQLRSSILLREPLLSQILGDSSGSAVWNSCRACCGCAGCSCKAATSPASAPWPSRVPR